jgi:hypothetical protein
MLGVGFFSFWAKNLQKTTSFIKKRNILSFISKKFEKNSEFFFQESIATIIITTDYNFEETSVGRFSLRDGSHKSVLTNYAFLLCIYIYIILFFHIFFDFFVFLVFYVLEPNRALLSR